MQSKQLSRNDLAVVKLDAVWRSYAPKHSIRPLNTMTVGDVDQTLCNASINVKPEGGTPGRCGAFDLYCLPHPREFD